MKLSDCNRSPDALSFAANTSKPPRPVADASGQASAPVLPATNTSPAASNARPPDSVSKLVPSTNSSPT